MGEVCWVGGYWLKPYCIDFGQPSYLMMTKEWRRKDHTIDRFNMMIDTYECDTCEHFLNQIGRLQEIMMTTKKQEPQP